MQNVTRIRWALALLMCAGCSAGSDGPSSPESVASVEQGLTCSPSLLKPLAATASSTQSASFPAKHAIDGSLTTRWSSAFSDPQWIVVDYGSQVLINEVKISWQTAFSNNYDVQVSSTSAGPWTTVYTKNPFKGGVDFTTNLSASGRFLRVFMHTRATGFGDSILEVAAFGCPNCVQPSAGDLIQNGGFDQVGDGGMNLRDWTSFSPPDISLSFSALDAKSCSGSGSVLATNSAPNGLNSGFYQCVPVVPGTTYNAGAWIRTPSGGAKGQTFLHVDWTTGPNCTGSIISDVLMQPSGAFDQWELVSQDGLVAPAGAQTAELYGAIIKNLPDTRSYQSNFDDMYLSVAPAHF